MPADQITLIGVGLLDDAIVHDEERRFALHLPHQRLDDLPQMRRCHRLAPRKASDLIMAQARSYQPGQTRGPRRAEELIK